MASVDPAPTRPVRVFIADDHAIVRRGLVAFLSEVGGFEVVGEADTGRRVLNADALLATCDVLLLDLSLPVVSGLEVLRRVSVARPDLPIVVHSMHPEGQFARRAFALGAAAYVSKDAPPRMLLEAIRRAIAGEQRPAAAGAPRAGVEQPAHAALSSREHDVFFLIVSGRTVSEVAAELDLHTSTVSNHLARIRKKLGVTTVVDMVAYAYAEGVLEHPIPMPASDDGAPLDPNTP